MIKIKKNINIAFLVCALLQITTITASSSVNQTNYNNAFLGFYQAINGKAASSISEAAEYIEKHKDSQNLTPMTTAAKSLNTKEAQRVGAFLADVNPALEPSKFPGLDSEANINTAIAVAKGLISPSSSAGSSGSDSGSSSSSTTSSSSSGSSGSASGSNTTTPSSSNQTLTATDTAAADLLKNIQSSIGTYNQYLTSLNKGIPALTIPSSPAGVPAA